MSINTVFRSDEKLNISHVRRMVGENVHFPLGGDIKWNSAMQEKSISAYSSIDASPLTSWGELSPLRNSSVAMLLLFLRRHRLEAGGACWVSPDWCIVGKSPVDTTSFVMTRVELRFERQYGQYRRFRSFVSISWSTVSVCTSVYLDFERCAVSSKIDNWIQKQA